MPLIDMPGFRDNNDRCLHRIQTGGPERGIEIE
jgi:hypothetical protein